MGMPAAVAKPMLFERFYPWLVLAACLDIMLTYVVLTRGGREVNALAAAVIDAAGHWGMIGYKLTIIIVVILICEFVGRHRQQVGQTLVGIAIALNLLPVVYTLGLLLR